MQVDTGCDADLVYDIPFRQLGLDFARTGPTTASLTGTIGGKRFEREPFVVRNTTGVSWLSRFFLSIQQRVSIWKGKQVLLGTIGAPFIANRVLVLDFVADRVAFLEVGQELPPAATTRITYAPIEYRDHKIFVPVIINGGLQRDLAFDTGSSAVPLLTTRDRWLTWTARKTDDPRNTVMRAWAWDRYINLLGAPIGGVACVGTACLDSPLAFFETSGAPNCNFERYPFRIAGVIGNALFDRRFTVVLDVPHRRIGVFRGSLAETAPL